MIPSHIEKLKALFLQVSLYDDQAAFSELFRSEYQRLHAFSLQYVISPESAEEVVNDVFVKLWNYRQQLSSINNPESYLFVAVRNQSLNYIRKYSHLHIALSGEGGMSALVAQSDPGQDIEWKELLFRLNQVVDELPDQCRKIFRLVKEEGFKTKQVAEILNISTRTVETQLYRAMKRLSQSLADHLPRKKKENGGIPPAFMFLFF